MTTALLTRVLLALALTLGVASPVLADCCDSLFGCAVAVVTEGLSCVVQEIVSTVKNLVNLVSNVLERTSGATQKASDGAQAYVNQTISDMTTQSQQSGADLAAALHQANAIYKEETSPIATSATHAGPTMAASSPTTTTGPNTSARPAAAARAKPAAQGSLIHPAVTAAAAQPASGSTSSTARPANGATPAPGAVSVQSTLPPHGSLAGLFEKAVKQIESLKAAGDPDVAKVGQFMTQARQSEGPGLQSALAVADKSINAPLRDMLSHLNTLLADPTHIFDPSDVVNQLANSVLENLDTNIAQLVEGITSGPQQAFDAAQPAYDELLTNAERAKEIAAAMSRAHTERSQASQNALSDLLPFPAVASSSNARARSLATGGRPLYAQLMSTAKTRKQQIAVAPVRDVKAIAPLAAQLKTLRGKAASARAAVPTYQSNFSRQLNATMEGKTQAQIDARRDQLIAQARTQLATDPKTRDAVIRLLTTETGKVRARGDAP
jgi:hypothetical protein